MKTSTLNPPSSSPLHPSADQQIAGRRPNPRFVPSDDNVIHGTPRTLRISMFGCGVVGTGVWNVIEAKRQDFRRIFGVELIVAGICVRHLEKPRDAAIPPHLFTREIDALLEDDSIDVALELIGGRFEAQTLIERALLSRKHVITANKLLLSHELPRLRTIASRAGVSLGYSASVCGSIPVLRALDEHRAGDTISKISGIVNGSTNFMLTLMGENGADYADALLEARRLGFLEADPTLDVSGADAAQKLSVLVYHAFGRHLAPENIPAIGIERLTRGDFDRARAAGKTIKLIASAGIDSITGVITASVRPELVPLDHLFAHTKNEFNAIEILTAHAGPQVLYGKGAGSLPTASAVISDVIELIGGE